MNKSQPIAQNIGIDVSSESLEASYSQMDEHHEISFVRSKSFYNSKTGVKQLIDWAQKHAAQNLDLSFTLEATGVYHELCAYMLYEKGCKVHLLLPKRSKRYADSLEYKSKTDRIDSRILARMGLERKLEVWSIPSKQFRDMKMLSREREQIIAERTMLLNRLHALEHSQNGLKTSIRRVKQSIRLLDKQLKEIEDEIRKAVKQDSELASRIQKLETIPGVSTVTAVTILAETDGFALIKSAKQLVSYAGLDVRIRESGKWKGKPKISKQGNSHIRRVLYMPALNSTRYNHCIRPFYERLTSRKDNRMTAVTAVQRKLLVMIYSMWKSGELYDPLKLA